MTLHQAVRDRGAVERDEGAVAARARVVDRPRDQLLAGAALAVDADVHVAGRHLVDAGEDVAHLRRVADDAVVGGRGQRRQRARRARRRLRDGLSDDVLEQRERARPQHALDVRKPRQVPRPRIVQPVDDRQQAALVAGVLRPGRDLPAGHVVRHVHDHEVRHAARLEHERQLVQRAGERRPHAHRNQHSTCGLTHGHSLVDYRDVHSCPPQLTILTGRRVPIKRLSAGRPDPARRPSASPPRGVSRAPRSISAAESCS